MAHPTVLTLDAGGTTSTFSAWREGREVVPPFTLPAQVQDLEPCLAHYVAGFERARAEAGGCEALSFAFPGPADYRHGVIGALANMPAFREPVPLGPLLEAHFDCPVFIHNDGDLFALGEALGGFLPEVNGALAAAGSIRRFRNLVGLTLGTGFGGGLVVNGELLRGDNGAAGEVWLLRHRDRPDTFVEEGVSLRALRRTYAEGTGIALAEVPEPRCLADIARGQAAGDREAARAAFTQLGRVAGEALAQVLTLTDGLAVLGGGLCGAADLFLPALLGELNGEVRSLDGRRFPRLVQRVHSWEDPTDRAAFLADQRLHLPVPGTGRTVAYAPAKRTAVGITRLGTSRAAALAAWSLAVKALEGA